ncbi:MAG: DUF3592 domain-containing protein [Peptostreptococcaceae bacterium]|nr:DUF3592 domain-containing protein [Peptostreptococcaceae bacterium]
MRDRHVQWILGIVFSGIGTFITMLSFILLPVFREDASTGRLDFPVHLMLLVIALPFALIGFFMLWNAIRQTMKSRRLRQYGIVKRGEIVDFEKTTYRVNHRYLECVIVQTQDGEIYRSEGLFDNKYNYGDELEILVDPQDTRVYEVLL